MNTKPLSDSYDAEDCARSLRAASSQDLSSTNAGQFLNCRKVVSTQPLRHLGVRSFSAREFNDRNHRVSVPINFSAPSIDVHEMGNCCIRSLSHVPLVM